jgi:hypothetical protein
MTSRGSSQARDVDPAWRPFTSTFGAEAVVAGAPAQPVSFDQDYGAAIANLRDTTKWIVAAVATTGAGVLVGSPLTKVGALPFGLRLSLAAAGAFVGFCVLGILYALAVRVLAIEEFSIASLATMERGPGGARARRMATAVAALMPSGCPTFESVMAKRAALAEAAQGGDGAARAQLDAFDALEVRLRAPLAFQQKRLRFDDLSRGLLALGPVLVASICLFAWAATAPDAPAALSSKPTLIHIAAADTPETRSGLGAEDGCYAMARSTIDVPAVIVADSPGYSDLIALPKAPCAPKRFLLKDGRLIFR